MKWILPTVLGLLLLIGSVDAVTISYASQYPPVQNSTYVVATSQTDAAFYPYYATDPTKARWGSIAVNGWQSVAYTNSSQRFHIDLGSAKLITGIYYENYAHFGGDTDRGVKDFTFWGSNTSGSFVDVVYSHDSGWTALTTSSSSFNQHTSSDTADPQYIYVTNPTPYRYYAVKIANNYGDADYVGFRHIQLQEPIKWEYTTPGTYYWVCPSGLTEISLAITGAGGSGAAGWTSGLSYYPGTGGKAGGHQTFSSLTSTPGTNYTIVVGAPGSVVYYGSVGEAGNLSSAFGYSYPGGLGGEKTTGGSNGGPGDQGFFSSTQFAVNGSYQAPFLHGQAGLGYGAGGGGGSSDNVDQNTAGGAGAQGYVGITKYGYTTGNIPNFVADITSGGPSTVVHFTDTSTITDSAGLAYNWSFGDGTYSTTPGDVLHVYTYTGDYTVSLTLTATSGTATETKTSYIIISTSVPVSTQPKSVKFRIVDALGTALPGATISVAYLNNSLPSNDVTFLERAFGIPSSVAEDMVDGSNIMGGTTDDSGGISFIMYPVLQYGITITNSSAGLSKYVTLFPQDTDYTIYCTLASQQKTVNSLQTRSGTSLPWFKLNATAYRLQVNYSDTSGATSAVRFIVMYRNGTELYNHSQAYTSGLLIDNYTVNNIPMGTELIWKYNATIDSTVFLPTPTPTATATTAPTTTATTAVPTTTTATPTPTPTPPPSNTTMYLEDYGIMADGSDETVYLQSAFAYATAHSSIEYIVFPEDGVIGLDDYVETPEDVELIGNNCTIKLLDDASINHENGFFYLHAGSYAHDLIFDGNMENQGGTATNGVMVYEDAEFADNEVKNVGAYSVFTYLSDNAYIHNNTVHNSWQYGISTGGTTSPYETGIRIENNTVYACDEVGIKIKGADGAVIANNTVTMPATQLYPPNYGDPAYPYGIHLYSNDEPNQNVLIRNNTVIGSIGAVWNVAIGSDEPDNPNSTIILNTLTNVQTGVDIMFNDGNVSYNTVTYESDCYVDSGSGNTITGNTCTEV